MDDECYTVLESLTVVRFNDTPPPSWASLVAQLVKNPPAMQDTWVRSLGWEDPLEEGMATHPSILAWRIPRTTVHGAAKRFALCFCYYCISSTSDPRALDPEARGPWSREWAIRAIRQRKTEKWQCCPLGSLQFHRDPLWALTAPAPLLSLCGSARAWPKPAAGRSKQWRLLTFWAALPWPRWLWVKGLQVSRVLPSSGLRAPDFLSQI